MKQFNEKKHRQINRNSTTCKIK